MAIAYCHIGIMSRGKGKSAVAAAAYRAREKLHNEREGTTYEYSRKGGLVHSEILAPAHAPAWASEREKLWNAVEQIEKQKNAQLAREVVLALPHELSHAQNIALARDYAQTFVQDGMVADLAVHDSGDGNPHAHIMLTMRAFEQDGEWAAKSSKEYLLDEQGEKILLPSGEYKSKKVDTVDWNSPDNVEKWRAYYEQTTNRHLELAGSPERIDSRSYERQGLDREGMIHLGHYAHELEQNGEHSVRGDINRQIEARNQQREALYRQQVVLEHAIAQEQEVLRQQEAARLQAEKEQAARAEMTRQEMVRQQAVARRSAALARRREQAAQREAALRQEKTISEEAFRKRAAEWERIAAEALKQEQARQASLTPEQAGREENRWEALAQAAAEREAEAARKEAEKEASEQQAEKARLQQVDILRRRQEAYRRYTRTFLRPHRLTRPAKPLEPPKKVDIREEASKQERHEKEKEERWQQLNQQLQDEKKTLAQLAREQEARREGLLGRLAKEQAGRVDWQNVRREQERKRINWAREKERRERQRPSWVKPTQREQEQERMRQERARARREERQRTEAEVEREQREQEPTQQYSHRPLTEAEREQTVSYEALYKDDAIDHTWSKREQTRDEPELDL